ncbi:1-deoxy-D-xylulose 5-phosphate reductoisomerase [Clostridia bacterium]|nr:1-deoxy-D-xylulose 5-phosphate reductoisomerase [Clostridia bacterium]
MRVKKIIVAGSTGSIGQQTLAAARYLGMRVCGLLAHSSIKLLEDQIREFSPSCAVVVDEEKCKELKLRIKDLDVCLLCGPGAIEEMIAKVKPDIVVNGITGIAGLSCTLATIRAGKTLALANKESLVVAGELVTRLAKEHSVQILPVDSEHSAIFQCLMAGTESEVKSLILTASGGPFFGKSGEFLENVSVEQVLKHPNWEMGEKITVDCATLMNKGFEVLEAGWLFGVDLEKIKVLIHPQSVVHSMVEFVDNSVVAQMSVPDMTGVIAYALTFPERAQSVIDELNLGKIKSLDFFEVDDKTFHGVSLARKAAALGGLYPCVLNGANEQLVEMFLCREVKFAAMAKILDDCLANLNLKNVEINEENIMFADDLARKYVVSHV